MSVSVYNIKKWVRMLTGKSVLHVNQKMGTMFCIGELKGYYNDLTEKVEMEPSFLESDELPMLMTEDGEKVCFPVAVFQYGLGSYDLFLKTGESKYIDKFLQIAKWAVANQEETGAWNNFFFYYPEHPYGAMCQGEGISVLLRAYKSTMDPIYLSAAEKALHFMLLPVKNGGTTEYREGMPCFLEYTHLPAVLNGWIFAFFGLYDYIVLEKQAHNYEKNDIEDIYLKSIELLKIEICKFDNGYWSMYDLDGKIASPFYHNLHIAQMHALYLVTGDPIFHEYEVKFENYKNSFIKSKHAFIVKAIQKIKE